MRMLTMNMLGDISKVGLGQLGLASRQQDVIRRDISRRRWSRYIVPDNKGLRSIADPGVIDTGSGSAFDVFEVKHIQPKTQRDAMGFETVSTSNFDNWLETYVKLDQLDVEINAHLKSLRSLLSDQWVPSDFTSSRLDTKEQANTAREPYRVRVTGPVRLFLSILRRWDMTDMEGATVLGAEETSVVDDLRSGARLLRTRDEKDRTRIFLSLYEGVYALFREPEAEKRWIRQPLQELQQASLLSLITEGSFLSLHRAREFVDYVNGRR